MKFWEIKQSAAKNELDLFVYGAVKGDDYDWWNDEVIKSETSANSFRDKLAEFSDVSRINIFINSYGGSVFEGTAIYSQLKRHPAEKVAYIDGFACSIASVIAMAADRVIMPKNTMMMIHNAWMFTVGNAAELRKAADDLDQINKGNRQAYLQKAGDKITEEKLIELLDAETWLTAEDCMAYGFADEYAETDADLEKVEEIFAAAKDQSKQLTRTSETIAAKLRELKAMQAEPDPVPAEPEPTENKILKLFKGL